MAAAGFQPAEIDEKFESMGAWVNVIEETTYFVDQFEYNCAQGHVSSRVIPEYCTFECGIVEDFAKIGQKCRVFIYGPFSVLDQDGNDLTPRNQKSRAVLAMLAVAPRGSRSRAWLRDKLWSDRAEEQGSASLRQALLDIRKSLGPALRDVLFADKYTVTLDLSQVAVDLVDYLSSEPFGQANSSIDPDNVSEFFLEGIDIRDPEFESWLTMERQVWGQRFRAHSASAKGDGEAGAGQMPDLSDSFSPKSHVEPSKSESAERRGYDGHSRWVIGLGVATVQGNPSVGRTLGAKVRESLAATLLESGNIELVETGGLSEFPAMRGSGNRKKRLSLIVNIRLFSDVDNCRVTIELQNPDDGSFLWSGGQEVPMGAARAGDVSQVFSLISRVEFEIANLLSRAQSDEGLHYAAKMHQAVTNMFGLSADNLDKAERILRDVIKNEPSAQAFAWMAFAKSFRIGQRFSKDAPAQISEAQYYSSRAMELDESNPLVLSLVAHIHSYLFNEYDLAASLFERALRANPAQPMGWDLYAMLHAYTGQYKKALSMANLVQNMGKDTPNSYYFDTTKCISSTLAGKHEEAIEAGEKALSQRPRFNSILRYLIASHAHLGNIETARDLVRRLLVVEPDFSLELLRDSGNPMLQTEGGQHFLAGLAKAGVRKS